MLIFLFVLFTMMSAIFSGLTIGMFSLSLNGLERKMRLGDAKAIRVHKVRKNGNFLLCTLLLGNAAVNTGIAVVSSELFGGAALAGVIATGIIFVFGEVLPQAIFSRYALNVGYYTSWLVEIFMVLMWLVAKPISMLLDKLLGEEFPETYNKQELYELIADHDGNAIDQDEHRIIMGAMRFSEKTAKDVMTPANIVFYLDENVEFSRGVIEKIKSENYSRIPVCSGSRDNVIGILYAKDLIGMSESKKSIGELCRKDGLLSIRQEMHLDALMNHFLRTKTHMSFVHDEYGVLRGIVTLEDVMEEVIGTEILDEADTVADLQHLAKQNSKIKMAE